MKRQPCQSPHGSAIIIALLLITLIAVLVIHYLTSMRMERNISRMHQQSVQASFYDQFARNTALSRLEYSFELGDGKLWATQPGAFHVYHNGEWENIDLHSGAASTTDNALSVNLNRPTLEDPALFTIADTGDFVGTNREMRVRWVYVDKDGTLSDTVTADSIGRFAFWVDDESGKVNVNTAWKQGVTRPLSDPAHVDLPTLGFSPAQADTIEDWRAGGGFFNTIEEVNAGIGNSTLVDEQRFNLTEYNHSPTLNPFGEPKLVLTTQKSKAGGSPHYLRILRNDPDTYVDPGLYANLDPALVNETVRKIATYLKRSDWPYPEAGNQSIAQKYAPVLAEQIAVNLIEYVRASESETPVVDPIRGRINAAGEFEYDSAYNGAQAIVGNNRGIRTTEVSVFLSAAPLRVEDGKDFYLMKVKREIHLPEHFGLESVNLSQFRAGIGFNFIGGRTVIALLANWGFIGQTGYGPGYVPNENRWPPGYVESGNTVLQKGGYEVVVQQVLLGLASSAGSEGRQVLSSQFNGVRLSLSRHPAPATSERVEVVPESSGPGTTGLLTYTPDADTVPEGSISSMAVSDPSINNGVIDWHRVTSNTFGSANGVVPQPPHHGPPQDSEGNAVTNRGQVFPPPGRTGIRSVAELGHVHTGLITHSNTDPGIPHRTLRLQPGTTGGGLPDWALLDLFRAPADPNARPLVMPNAGEGGRVNLNSVVLPFQDSSGNDLLTRRPPLKAVLSPLFANPDTLVDRLLAKTPAADPTYLDLASPFYYSPAQIVEVEGISDSGETSEQNLFGTIDRLTTRSGVFSIYSVGQSIQRAPSGNINITSEQRSKTLIEFDTTQTPAVWKVLSRQEL